jgi:hypothetical protein
MGTGKRAAARFHDLDLVSLGSRWGNGGGFERWEEVKSLVGEGAGACEKGEKSDSGHLMDLGSVTRVYGIRSAVFAEDVA